MPPRAGRLCQIFSSQTSVSGRVELDDVAPDLLHPHGYGEEITTTIETNTGEADFENVRAFVSTETCPHARPLRLDHAHRARELRPGCDEGLVRQGPWMDLQAEFSYAGRRVPPVCLLRQRWRGNSSE